MSYPECRTCGYKSSAAKHLNETELQTLEFGCAEVLFKKGEVVFREGTLATNTIYLKRGMVKVHMKGPSGDKILKLIKAPTYLGLPTTFGDRINQYSATAISDAEVCFISLDTFKDFITKMVILPMNSLWIFAETNLSNIVAAQACRKSRFREGLPKFYCACPTIFFAQAPSKCRSTTASWPI